MNERRTFYRIVKSDPPTVDDFTSTIARGLPPRNDDPETVRLERGLSVFDSEVRARSTARRFPRIGRFIAHLEIDPSPAITVERTAHSEGHYTIWGEASELLARVVRVQSVERS